MFKFSLESVLALRKNTEDMKKRELGLLNLQKQAIEKEMQSLELQQDRMLQTMRLSVQNTIHVETLKGYNIYYPIFEKKRIKIAEDLRKVEEALSLKQEELKEAVKERKILENLKERHFELYREEEKKQEQQIVDEIVTYKYARKEEGE